MKPIQWIIAVVVLVLMVFAVTFIMNFLGENTTTGQLPPPPPGEDTFLAFWETSYPGVTQFQDQEFNHTGGDHDFLFQNTTDENVTVTLSHLSCHCASVTLFLASEEWRMNLARMTASKMAQSAQFALNPWLVFGFAGPPDTALSDAAAKIEAVGRFEPEKSQETTFTVPPRAVGWFRVGWPGDKNGTNTYTATIGTKTANKQGSPAELKTMVRWVNPAYVAYPSFYVGEFPAAELQKQPRVENVYVYSTTRLTLRPKEATLVPKWKMEESPIIVGEPEYLMPPYTWLENRLKAVPPTGQDVFVPERILCLYRIPVTFQERSPDKKRPLPFGLLRMRVRVTFADENVDPVFCFMHGTVRGDVRVGGSGQLNFGNFQEASGSNGSNEVTLYTPSENLILEIDKERTWPHLLDTAKLVQNKDDKTAWKLSAYIKPHSGVQGHFPRENDDEYFDTAIYVKTKGDSSRSLRIPTGGN